jgi:hypothetical protein
VPRGPIAQVAWRVSPLSFGRTCQSKPTTASSPSAVRVSAGPGLHWRSPACKRRPTFSTSPTARQVIDRASKTTARPATPTTSPSKKSSQPGQPHRPSWHSWRAASTCGARSPASWTWVQTASPSWLRLLRASASRVCPDSFTSFLARRGGRQRPYGPPSRSEHVPPGVNLAPTEANTSWTPCLSHELQESAKSPHERENLRQLHDLHTPMP